MELIAFKIISFAGAARSEFMQSTEFAENGNMEEANLSHKNGKLQLIEAHKIHKDLIQQEAAGTKLEFQLLLVHAEDQLMSAELMKDLTRSIINLHKKFI